MSQKRVRTFQTLSIAWIRFAFTSLQVSESRTFRTCATWWPWWRLVPAVLRNIFFGGKTGKESLVDFDIRYKVKSNAGILLQMQRKLLPLINCICIVTRKTIYVNCLCFNEEPFLRFLCRVWRSTLKKPFEGLKTLPSRKVCRETLFFSLHLCTFHIIQCNKIKYEKMNFLHLYKVKLFTFEFCVREFWKWVYLLIFRFTVLGLLIMYCQGIEPFAITRWQMFTFAVCLSVLSMVGIRIN